MAAAARALMEPSCRPTGIGRACVHLDADSEHGARPSGLAWCCRLTARTRCHNQRLRILHAIHDFLPRHHAGSEIYAFELCRELAARHHVSILCAEHDPLREHGHVEWRVYKGLPVIELVNNWICGTFAETYRPAAIGERIEQLLDAVQPEVLHVHSLLNLSFDLPAMARRRAIPVVATLHDYSLVCPSGGQRIHRAAKHVCNEIDAERCVRCFRESPFHSQASFGRMAAVARASGTLRQAAVGIVRRFPRVAGGISQAAARAPILALSREDVDARLAAARSVFDGVDVFVAPSPSLAAEFERLGMDAGKIKVSDYGFRKMTPDRREGGGGRLRIGFVGTLVWHKGVHVLLEAAGRLPRESYELTVFGDPTVFPQYSAELRRLAEGLPVRFMGAFDREAAASVYAQMDVLVVPSLWMENSPLVIHEAFMAGIPVVGARMGGIADLVEDGRSGLLYEATSIEQLAAALLSLIEGPQRLRTMSRFVQALPPVKSIAEDAREWEAVYADALRRRTATARPA
jgi:glycosyltransferase involved in cell wall biosynthesis